MMAYDAQADRMDERAREHEVADPAVRDLEALVANAGDRGDERRSAMISLLTTCPYSLAAED